MRIDHVLYAVRDLDTAAERLQTELGLEVLSGGRHDGLGTENRIVPLGGGYLELLAVADAEEVGRSELGRALQALIERTADGLAAWAVAVKDVEPIAARLGTSAVKIVRKGFSARVTGLLEATREPFLPFFVARDEDVADPGSGSHVGGISWIEVAGDQHRLDSWLGGAVLPISVVEGSPGVRAVGIGSKELRTG